MIVYTSRQILLKLQIKNEYWIVGLGLIGGSLGLDLRSRGYKVLGVSRREQTCTQAIARGVVDQASVNPAILATADVVFICTPLAAI
jgi:arogenate dehydrogenase (NADP+)